MELIDVVKKLNGPIGPVGDSVVDGNRYQNLEQMLDMLDTLIDDVCAVSKERNAHQSSLQKAGKKAHQWLCDVAEGLEDFKNRED